MRKHERLANAAADSTLIDLRDQRDQLSIQISLLNERGLMDPAALHLMQRNLLLLDHRIAKHHSPTRRLAAEG